MGCRILGVRGFCFQRDFRVFLDLGYISRGFLLVQDRVEVILRGVFEELCSQCVIWYFYFFWGGFVVFEGFEDVYDRSLFVWIKVLDWQCLVSGQIISGSSFFVKNDFFIMFLEVFFLFVVRFSWLFVYRIIILNSFIFY